MMNIFIIILSLASVTLSNGTSAIQWLELQTGVRAIGMAGAQTAAGDDISSSLYNPANVSYIEGQQVFFNKTNYIADISHSFFGYGRQMTELDVLGINIFFLDSGWIPETTDEANTGNDIGSLGNYKVYNFLANFSYARSISDKFKVGLGLKYFREDIDNMYAQGLAFDFGAHYSVGLGIKLGLSINNVGPDVKFEGDGLQQYVDDSVSPSGILMKSTGSFSLPQIVRLGIEGKVMGSDRMSLIANNLLGLSVAVDILKPITDDMYAALGSELSISEMFFVRLGSRINHDTASFSFGLGLEYSNFKIDYSLSDYGDLGQTGQFGISLKF